MCGILPKYPAPDYRAPDGRRAESPPAGLAPRLAARRRIAFNATHHVQLRRALQLPQRNVQN